MINKKNIDLLVKLNMSKANMVICMYIVSNLKIEKQKNKQKGANPEEGQAKNDK